jgi:hypothetical protein
LSVPRNTSSLNNNKMTTNYFYNQIFAGLKAICKRNRMPMLAIALALGMMPLTAFAATGNVNDWGELTTAVGSGGSGDVILSTSFSGTAQLTIDRSLTLDLNGWSLTIDVNSGHGIKIASGKILTIMDSSSPSNGTLIVTNNYSASDAIESAAIHTTDGTLIINSGTVTANGGYKGAGIGGGYKGDGGIITINGGTVEATGGDYGAGIGGGMSGTGGNITINGGTVTATSGSLGAGIGGGVGGSAGNILITGANTKVTAKGGSGAQDIGNGSDYTGPATGNVFVAIPNLTLNSQSANAVQFTADPASTTGTVTATLPAPFETAGAANDGVIELLTTGLTPTGETMSVITTLGTTDNVTFALSGYASVDKTGADLMTSGATVDFVPPTTTISAYALLKAEAALTASTYGTIKLSGDITDGDSQLTIARDLTLDLNGKNLTIVVTALNGIKIAAGKTLTIIDSAPGSNKLAVTNTLGTESTGNGAGINTTDGTLIIESGTVEATGGYKGAGIGGGDGANIPGGYDGCGGNITINGGTVEAAGGIGSAGIGGGFNGTSGNITINGGTVEAIGGNDGAGIGSGFNYFGGAGSSNILITGENTKVTATGGTGAQDIGNGSIGMVSNMFVAIPALNLTLPASPTTTVNDVLFTANPATTTGTVTATLPFPFNVAPFTVGGVYNLLTTGLTPTGETLSVITTFTTDEITFALEDYTSVIKNGTALTTSGATVPFAPVPATVTTAAIPGVTAPVAGATPVTSITATTEYTGAVTWTKADDTPFAGNFDYATAYKATITLTAKAGFTLTGVTANFFTVAGATSATNSADGGVVTAVFPATAAAPVTISAIPGVTAPVAGATPVTSITATTEYTGAVTWTKADDTPFTGNFDYATAYKATITLTAKAGFTLTGVTANFFTVAGATTVTNAADGGVVTAVFPATAAAPVTITAIPGVTAPVAGATPVTSITATTEYTGTVSWTKADDTPFTGNFDYATAYKATITLTAKAGFTLTGVTANFFTVAGATSATNSADGGVITAVFPATAAASAKTVSVGAQSGTLTAGTAGSATFTVTTANIANGAYTATLGGAPAGVTAGAVTIASGSGTLTVSTTAATPSGTHPLTLTIDGITSAGFNLVVNPAPVTPNPDPDPTIYVSGVSLNLASLEGKVGDDGVELVATVTPRFATDRNVRWSTSDPLVATVTHYGLVNFVGAGTATITVITLDGDYIAECVVTVSPDTGIEDVSPSATLYAVPIGDGLQVHGLVPGEVFSIYNISGQLLFSGKATANEQFVSLRERGVYIVTTGNRSVKAAY